MSTLAKHLPALIFLAIVLGFIGSLDAIGSITGAEALAFAAAPLAGVAAFLGFRLGVTTPTTTVTAATAAPVAAPVTAPATTVPPAA